MNVYYLMYNILDAHSCNNLMSLIKFYYLIS